MNSLPRVLLVMLFGIALGCATPSRSAPKTNVKAPAALPNGQMGKNDSVTAPTPIANVPEHLDPSAVSLLVRKEVPALRRCYLEHGDQRRSEERIRLRWTIDDTGRVLDVQVEETTLQNDDFERCLVERIGSWSFPPPAGAIDVVYPFVFRPR